LAYIRGEIGVEEATLYDRGGANKRKQNAMPWENKWQKRI